MKDICFVIQPFDRGKFDKRYEDVFKPAIIEADLEPYRVDCDDCAQIPINAIEEKIKAAKICLADITLNNPNVWYEVGYALASNKTTILVCSDERTDNYPFDVSARNILKYGTESTSDYEELRKKLKNRIVKLSANVPVESIETINENVNNFGGLSYQEVSFLGALLTTQDTPDEYVSAWGIKEQMKKIGLNDLAFNISARKLLAKKFIETSVVTDYNGNEYAGYNLAETGNEWVIVNGDKFSVEYKDDNTDLTKLVE